MDVSGKIEAWMDRARDLGEECRDYSIDNHPRETSHMERVVVFNPELGEVKYDRSTSVVVKRSKQAQWSRICKIHDDVTRLHEDARAIDQEVKDYTNGDVRINFDLDTYLTPGISSNDPNVRLILEENPARVLIPFIGRLPFADLLFDTEPQVLPVFQGLLYGVNMEFYNIGGFQTYMGGLFNLFQYAAHTFVPTEDPAVHGFGVWTSFDDREVLLATLRRVIPDDVAQMISPLMSLTHRDGVRPGEWTPGPFNLTRSVNWHDQLEVDELGPIPQRDFLNHLVDVIHQENKKRSD